MCLEVSEGNGGYKLVEGGLVDQVLEVSGGTHGVDDAA